MKDAMRPEPDEVLERHWFYTSMPWTRLLINRSRRRRGAGPFPWRDA